MDKQADIVPLIVCRNNNNVVHVLLFVFRMKFFVDFLEMLVGHVRINLGEYRY